MRLKAAWPLLASVLLAGASVFLMMKGQVRLAIMLAIAVPVLTLAAIQVRLGILAILIYVVLMGDFRRLLIPIIGWSGQDPLLLLSVAFSILLCGMAIASRLIRIDTPLARWVLALTVVMILQIFNPKQGGLIVGVAGALFFLGPIVWFWIGRTYADLAFMKLFFNVVLALAVVAAVMGYYQSFYGYLPYQMDWYEIAGYTALGPRHSLKAISLFSSTTEYSMFVLTAATVAWAAVLTKKPAMIILVPIMIAGAFLTGSRGPIVHFLLAATTLWAVKGRSMPVWIGRGVLALCIGIGGLVWSLTQLQEMQVSGPARHHVQHQVDGLLNPTDAEHSTAGLHARMAFSGYRLAFREPLGRGIGVSTKAAGKFGGQGYNTETDVGNVLVSTGIIGGLIYHVLIVLTFITAFKYWFKTRNVVGLSILGIITLSFLGWLAGGRYAVAVIVWICIGALDRLNSSTES